MEKETLTALFRRYSDDVFRLAYSYLGNRPDAEDVCQTVFLKFLEKPRTFQSPEHEKAWVIRCAVNACKDVLKSFFRRCTVPLEDWQEASTDLPEDAIARRQALKSLPQKYREVIYLHYYEGYKTDEIARMLNEKPSTVRNRLRDARMMLKKTLGGEA